MNLSKMPYVTLDCRPEKPRSSDSDTIVVKAMDLDWESNKRGTARGLAVLSLVFSLVLLPLIASWAERETKGTIEKVSSEITKKSYRIHIKGKGPLQHSILFAENPQRLILDFASAKNKLGSQILEVDENPLIFRIRTSQYLQGKDNIARVVVDLKTDVDYLVEPDDHGLVLSLSQKIKQTQSSIPALPADKKTDRIQNTDFHVGPEDLLEINVFELPQFNITTRILGDGTITMPLIGGVEVRGLTKKQVEEKIAAALQLKYVNNANVTVHIKEYKSHQVSLLGAVKIPGAYYIFSHRSLLQLISEAGGLTSNAGRKCFIFRMGSPKIEIDLYDLMNYGKEELNVSIYPGDVVNIPPEEKVIVYVLGAVRNPGVVESTTSMPVTLLAVIARAGGPSDRANQSGIQIKRKDEKGNQITIKADLKDILAGKRPDIPLLPGDVIHVPESFF